MMNTTCRKCHRELWLRDEDAGSLKEETMLCNKCYEIQFLQDKEHAKMILKLMHPFCIIFFILFFASMFFILIVAYFSNSNQLLILNGN